ncbi:MAG TPA: DUF4349 domain-containing protein [Kofleriaceae bacterium]|nr:DUF4349 domain-containing protein [Kofleriaceae bacterium]
MKSKSSAYPQAQADRSVLMSGPSEGESVTVTADAAGDDGGGGSAPAPASSAVAAPIPEKMVIEGWIQVEVEDAAATAEALRAEVEKLGGRIISERLDGAATSWSASIKLRLPPAQVGPAIGWLEDQGDVTSKRIDAQDVSRTLFDQQIALDNLRITLDRLRKLMEAGGLKMEEILAIEREMTRLRGEIERIEGEKRFLEDRVALATIDVSLSRREGVLLSPKTKIYPGPRLALLTLFGSQGRQRNRLGGGVAMHVGIPRVSLELDIFDDVDAEPGKPREPYAVLATFGGAMYSDFLGRGQRAFLNPYIGFRGGYGYLDYHAFAVQAEVGLELFKHTYFLIDASARATAFLGKDDVDAGVVSALSAVFAF